MELKNSVPYEKVQEWDVESIGWKISVQTYTVSWQVQK